MGSHVNIKGRTKKDSPLVSVIVPTHNRSWSLRRCIGSVFKQTYRPIECIIVDDGSTDDSPIVIARLVNEAPEGITVRHFRQENGGANSARNRGIMESQGEFICYLDSDDELVEDSIAVRAEPLAENLDVDFCYGRSAIRSEDGKVLKGINESWPPPKEARIARYLFDTNAPLIRRSTCLQVGLWRNDDRHGQEYEYFARLKFFSRRVVFLDRVVSIYVRHGNESIFHPRSREFLRGLFRMLFAVKALVRYTSADTRAERAQLCTEFRNLAKAFYREGEYLDARAALAEALVVKWRFGFLCEWLAITALSALRNLLSVYKKRHPSISAHRECASDKRGERECGSKSRPRSAVLE